MASEKTDAIVLRVVPFSETSVVVTMLSRDFGKISALAKGAYRPRSPFEGALDLGCLCCVVFIRKSSDALDLLTEAKLQRRFRAAHKTLEKLYAGYYVLELLRELTEDGEAHSDLFRLTTSTLALIDDDATERHQIADLITSFELKALRILGHAPSIDDCASCGKVVGEQRRVAFGMLSGGVLCGSCRHRTNHVVSLGQDSRTAMRERINDLVDHDLNPHQSRVGGEIRGIMNRYMSHHAGKTLKMHKMLSGLTIT